MSASACVICLCDWASLRDPVVTKCGHLFCWPCIYTWISSDSSSTCPNCKYGLLQINASDFVPIYGHHHHQQINDKDVPPRPAPVLINNSHPVNAEGNNNNTANGSRSTSAAIFRQYLENLRNGLIATALDLQSYATNENHYMLQQGSRSAAAIDTYPYPTWIMEDVDAPLVLLNTDSYTATDPHELISGQQQHPYPTWMMEDFDAPLVILNTNSTANDPHDQGISEQQHPYPTWMMEDADAPFVLLNINSTAIDPHELLSVQQQQHHPYPTWMMEDAKAPLVPLNNYTLEHFY